MTGVQTCALPIYGLDYCLLSYTLTSTTVDIGVTLITHGQNMTTTRTKKEPIEHRDLLNKKIAVGDIVAFAESGSQYVGKIVKLTPKRVKIDRITTRTAFRYGNYLYQRPPGDVVIIEGAHVSVYIMAHSN